MSTKTLAATDRANCGVPQRPQTLAHYDMYQSPFDLGTPLCRSLAAINATWIDLTNQRLKENFRLPRELAACTSVPAMLRAYRNYCEAAIRQYESGLSEFRQIALQLFREVPAVSFMPAKATGEIQERSAHSAEPATDDALP
jgi:hypothetical protein